MNDIEQLSKILGQLLLQRRWVVTAAESCTGGGVAQAITDVAGSSQWFSYGFISYSNEAKQQLLGVENAVIEQYGAVSEPVVNAMALGALQQSEADVAVAISGIAGPGGGTRNKPVGTVCIAWAIQDIDSSSQIFQFSGDRKSVRNQSVKKSLAGLIEIIQKNTV